MAQVHQLAAKPRRAAQARGSGQRAKRADNAQRSLPVDLPGDADEAPDMREAIERLKHAPRGHKAKAIIKAQELRTQRLRDLVAAMRARTPTADAVDTGADADPSAQRQPRPADLTAGAGI